MTETETRRHKATARPAENGARSVNLLSRDYFRIRDFEYAQPLYDLAFLLEVAALAKGTEVPKYRTFALWRAGYSLDGYGTTIDRWLDGALHDEDLDCVPSRRIRQYLTSIRRKGRVPELRTFRGERFERCLRLRSVRGLGPSKIALALSSRTSAEEWIKRAAINQTLNHDRVMTLYEGGNPGPWQTAHVVPPLLRFLNTMEESSKESAQWDVLGISDALEPVTDSIRVLTNMVFESVDALVGQALKKDRHFCRSSKQDVGCIKIRHQMGWGFVICPGGEARSWLEIPELAAALDPLANNSGGDLLSDLHLHTAWSDGNASVNAMAMAAVASGLKYFAVTDHSRTAKLQGGLTPPLWLRQANALTLARAVCPVLHGIEVDILRNGTLDLPHSLLAAADIAVASVHSSWTDDIRANTDRLLQAIESGCIDVIAHPTSALVGTPGVPDYLRSPADVHWDEVFEACARWRVALEFNCFPSRLDLPLNQLRKASEAGCAISIGSDSHARSHLINRRFGQAALRRLNAPLVLNRLSYEEVIEWIRESRGVRKNLPVRASSFGQASLPFAPAISAGPLLRAHIKPPQNIPDGSRVLGIDLTAGDKATGVAVLDDCSVDTCSLFADDEILDYVKKRKPKIVSIDSPLGLPGGGTSINPDAGIMRVAEHDLASIGIPAYPSLIDSMQNLTLRGIRLRRAIEQFSRPPRVIESYPGAAQDILSIPRKQKSLDLLREGLRRLGLKGPGLDTHSHDEMDAITSAVVGRYFEAGSFEPMGIPSEAQLIVPKVSPLRFEKNPVICLAGKTGVGKSVVARYLSVFYGFTWIKTRDLISELLIEDSRKPLEKRMFLKKIDPTHPTEDDLRDFGAILLNDYEQIPLRIKLTKAIKCTDQPIVVDSIRDVADVDSAVLDKGPLVTWFVDCNDAIIQQRRAAKKKLGESRAQTGSPVDRTAPSIRKIAECIVSNNGSLEELRWRVDDTLFAAAILSGS